MQGAQADAALKDCRARADSSTIVFHAASIWDSLVDGVPIEKRMHCRPPELKAVMVMC